VLTKTALGALARTGDAARLDVHKAWLVKGATYHGEDELPGIPASHARPSALVAVDRARKSGASEAFVHFYIDDRKFRGILSRPKSYLDSIRRFSGAISPDFSVYREMPLNRQLDSTYWNRAVGWWLARQGVDVIPNVRWGDKRTYRFCFEGAATRSTVAVGSHGCVKSRDERRHFMGGFDKMIETLRPTTVVVYGPALDCFCRSLFSADTEILAFPSDISQLRRAA
jgi:hypothetical protein